MLTEAELKAHLRRQLAPTADAKPRLAKRLGVEPAKLTKILRDQAPVCDQVAERMGFRRVTLFERVDAPSGGRGQRHASGS